MLSEHDKKLTGCDDMREWLAAHGFRIAYNALGRDNDCNWYAYRRSAMPARECECNAGKPKQVVIYPYRLTDSRLPTGAHESYEVDVTGEAGGVWYRLQAYSLRNDELRERLGDIETSLIAAWNALQPNVGIEPPRSGRLE